MGDLVPAINGVGDVVHGGGADSVVEDLTGKV